MLKYTFVSHPDHTKLVDALQKVSIANEKIDQHNKERVSEMQIERIQKVLSGNAPVIYFIFFSFFFKKSLDFRLCWFLEDTLFVKVILKKIVENPTKKDM